jgi:hypothetical protein
MNQALYILKCAFGIALGILVGLMCMYLCSIGYAVLFEVQGEGVEPNLVPHTFLQIAYVLFTYFLFSFFSTYLATRIAFGSFYIIAALMAIAIITFSAPSMIGAKFPILLVVISSIVVCAGTYLGAKVNFNFKKKILINE